MTLPNKDPAEYVVVTFAYADEIGTATISSAVIDVTVITGTDGAVGSMKEGAHSISGSDVLQMMKLGVNPNDYGLRCLATLSDGRKLLRAATLPVRTGG